MQLMHSTAEYESHKIAHRNNKKGREKTIRSAAKIEMNGEWCKMEFRMMNLKEQRRRREKERYKVNTNPIYTSYHTIGMRTKTIT